MKTIEQLNKEDEQIAYTENESVGDTAVRVDVRTGEIQVNLKIFNKYHQHLQYFWLKWAYHKYNNGNGISDLNADKKALKDCMIKDYNIREILKGIFTFLSKPTANNKNRMDDLNNFLTKEQCIIL